MSRLTPLILLLLVLGLGYLAVRQTEYEAENPLRPSEALFEGVQPERVRAVRLENIRASWHFRFENDGSGRWFLTDPIRWPADPARFDEVAQIIQRNRGEPVPEALVEEAEASLDPPIGFIETLEVLEDGSERRVRVEVGAADIDGVRRYVRRDGELFRTLGNIEVPFDFHLEEYRSRRLFGLAGLPARVQRVGAWYAGDLVVPLGLEASLGDDGWLLTDPVTVPGDPNVFAAWLAFLSGLQAKGFASDEAEPDLAFYGLDTPELTIRVSSASGGLSELHVSSPDEGAIYAQRGTQPTIYTLDADILPFLLEASENFYASRIAIVERRQIQRIVIGRADDQLAFTRERERDGGLGRWLVTATARGAEGDAGQPEVFPADGERLSDLLSAVESAEVKQYFSDLEVGEVFGEDASSTSLIIEARDVPPMGGRFAADAVDGEDGPLTPYLATGSTIAGGVAPEVAEWTRHPLEFFRDRLLWTLTDARLKKLRVARPGEDAGARQWVRGQNLSWRPAEEDRPAAELDLVLDHLVFLKASKHLSADARPAELVDPVEVTFTDAYGELHTALIGLDGEGVAHVRVGDLVSVLDHQPLHGDLGALLE